MIEFTDVAKLPVKDMVVRGISRKAAAKYGIKAEVNAETGKVERFYYPLYRDGSIAGYQTKLARKPGNRQKGDVGRVYRDKTLKTTGCLPFGSAVAGNSGKMVIVTEGAEDCAAAWEMFDSLGKNYRVVSTLGTDGWKRTLEYFEQFDKVLIAYDMDEAGRKASNEFAAALSPGKAAMVRWDGPTDPNALLIEGKAEVFKEAVWNAKPYSASAIIHGEAAWLAIENYTSPEFIPYPAEFEVLNEKLFGMRRGEISLWTSGTGCGKCLSPETPVRMADGTVRQVGGIKVGELLLGPDGLPRTVLAKHSGHDHMFDVVQSTGMTYRVNSRHTLSLKRGQEVVNIDLPDYRRLPRKEREALRGWVPSTPFVGGDSSLPIDPWLLGLWYAEGRSRACGMQLCISQQDYPTIAPHLPAHTTTQQRGAWNVRITTGRGKGTWIHSRPEVWAKDAIPDEVMGGSVVVRSSFLAGWLDGDGSLIPGGCEVIVKSPILADQVVTLARSLGYRVASVGKFSACPGFAGAVYQRIRIKGITATLPMKVRRKVCEHRRSEATLTTFSVVPVGVGEYVGLEVSGDKLFLLEDYTVVHNSAFLRRIKQHVMQNTTWKLGDVELEETKEKTIRAILQYQGKKRLKDMTPEEKRAAWAATYGTERLFTVDRRSRLNGGTSLLSQMKQLRHGYGCDIIMLDHITLAADEMGDGKEGLAAQDKMMADLLELVESTNVHIALISHLRKSGTGGKSFEEGGIPSLDDLKGSGSVKQICMDIIALGRNLQHPDPYQQNVTKMRVLKNREEGNVGDADRLFYNKDTYEFEAAQDDTPDEGEERDF